MFSLVSNWHEAFWVYPIWGSYAYGEKQTGYGWVDIILVWVDCVTRQRDEDWDRIVIVELREYHRLKCIRHVFSTHIFSWNQVYPKPLIKNLTCMYFLLNHPLIPELGNFTIHSICKAAASHIPSFNVPELPPACCREKVKVLGPLVKNSHIR